VLAAVACLLGGVLVCSSQAVRARGLIFRDVLFVFAHQPHFYSSVLDRQRKSLVYAVLTYATIALAVLYCPPGKRTTALEDK
jgi:hypothetical protein